jgi:hypothetical protein
MRKLYHEPIRDKPLGTNDPRIAFQELKAIISSGIEPTARTNNDSEVGCALISVEQV